MSTIKVDVKWQKQSFGGVEIDMTQPPQLFKLQLFSLTGVAPERQKIMGFKGGLLKDDADWAVVAPKPGQKVTMMGTADAVPQAPAQAQTFVEDLPEEEQDTTGLSKYGAGLENLGNTCYMNSTLQCLYAVPELREKLQAAAAGGNLASSLGSLFGRMERSAQPVPPTEFLMTLRRAFPQFDQRTREGVPMQQDAEECWGAVLGALRGQVTGEDGGSEVQRLLGVRTKAVLKCEESDESMAVEEVEVMLKCNISSEVNHLAEGLALGLKGDREKTSAALGRLANFRGEAKVVELPPYLTVQMVRFFYKADVQQKAKILRKVSFPLLLDLFDFCSDGLKEKLQAPRLAFKEAEDAKVGLLKRQKVEKEKVAGADGDAAMTDAAPAAAAASSAAAEAEDKVAKHAGELTGRYELIGVLTHKGRSADSGHYVSWVRQDDGQWIQFDDDNMIVRKSEDVLALSGGGDWHMAYLLLFKAQRVPASE